ncbi:MAG: MBOAT family protein, partial [Romboutsia sp.]|nr:MBOAT family protein [Romboutsia sp.]
HALIIDKNRGNIKSKLALISSIIINLGILFYFKYTDFFIDISNKLIGTNFELLGLTLPVGISFYTFQTMSYSIDVYRGNVKVQKNLLNLATYVTLFPQLVAGPIVRYETVSNEIDKRNHSFDLFYEGVCRFIFGLSKKVLIANNVGIIWAYVKALNYSELSLLTAWLGIISFALQIYFDFSGYSDMAIGLGYMFGFNFCENFNYPYISKSITEFWRRWHMSLGQWFRDYLYIPLGGNRCNQSRWILNIFIVWSLTGFWHGAGINFICWGLYFGMILALEKLFISKFMDNKPNFFKHFYVITLVLIGWVLFEIESITNIFAYLKAMFFNFKIYDKTFIYLLIPNSILLLVGLSASTPIYKKILDNSIIKNIVLIIGLVLSVAFLVDSYFNPFLYFRF